ncbi:MAG: hypothetical protein E7B61_15545, partial [Clostridiales bacterium]|nr:hypothetical protein [Clostridiales bacterium]
TVFPAQNEYPQNKKINFVIFYNDLCIPLNSNKEMSVPRMAQTFLLVKSKQIGYNESRDIVKK